jgi:hypothetical protein
MTSSGKTGFTCALIGHILIPTALRLRNRWCDTRRSSNERRSVGVGLGRGVSYLWGGRLSLTGTCSKLAPQTTRTIIILLRCTSPVVGMRPARRNA